MTKASFLDMVLLWTPWDLASGLLLSLVVSTLGCKEGKDRGYAEFQDKT